MTGEADRECPWKGVWGRVEWWVAVPRTRKLLATFALACSSSGVFLIVVDLKVLGWLLSASLPVMLLLMVVAMFTLGRHLPGSDGPPDQEPKAKFARTA